MQTIIAVIQNSLTAKYANLKNNKSFPRCLKPLFQSEAKCKTIDMNLNSHAKKNHFQIKGFSLTLVLRVRMFGTQKWPLGHFEVARGLARSRIALWELLWGRKRFFYWLLGV